MGEGRDVVDVGVGQDPETMSCDCHCRDAHPAYYAAALRNLSTDSPREAHERADEILLAALPDDVREAYEDLVARAPWWACA